MVTYALQEMNGRQRGRLLRGTDGKFVTRTQWMQNAEAEIQEYFKKIKHYERFVSENPDLKVLIDAEKQKIAAKEAEMRLVNFSKRGIKDRVRIYREAMQNQGMSGTQLEEQVERYKNGLMEERRQHFENLRGKNNARNIAETGKKSAKPGFFKSIGNFFKSIGKAIKGNKGKTALVTGAVALTAGAIGLANSCENKTQLPPVTSNPTDSTAVNPTDTTAVAPEDVIEEQPAEEQVIEEQSAAEQLAEEKPKSADLQTGDRITLPDGNIHIVGEDETIWSIGRDYLTKKNKNINGYEPSNSELCKQRDELMKLNNLQYDNTRQNKDYYVNIYPKDTIRLAN